MIRTATARRWFYLVPILLAAGTSCRPQVTLQADKPRVKQGESTNLTWISKNANTVTINGEPVAHGGSKTVTPDKTTNYEAIAKRGDKIARAFARVDVEMPAFPSPTLSLTADQGAIERGQSTTLRWSSTNADSVEIVGFGRLGTTGSRTVSPTTSTTYNGTARGKGGEATASFRLTVTEPAPPPPPPPPKPPEPVTPRIEEAFAAALSTIHFMLDSSALEEEAQATLRRAGDWLNRTENRTIRFRIEGNCDERGSQEYNFGLGDRRANSARDFLISLGVSADRIETVSYGKERPVDSGHSEDAWWKNRRDDFVYLSGGPSRP